MKAACEPGSRPSPDTKSASIFILNFPASETLRSLRFLVTAAHTDRHRLLPAVVRGDTPQRQSGSLQCESPELFPGIIPRFYLSGPG